MLLVWHYKLIVLNFFGNWLNWLYPQRAEGRGIFEAYLETLFPFPSSRLVWASCLPMTLAPSCWDPLIVARNTFCGHMQEEEKKNNKQKKK